MLEEEFPKNNVCFFTLFEEGTEQHKVCPDLPHKYVKLYYKTQKIF